MTKKMREALPCLVCGCSERTSTHFGSTACMACASFFRRTVSFGIRFLCKANNECQISEDVKFICRSCRYNNCIKAGMRRDLVQQKRDNSRVPKYVLESRREGIREVVRGYTTSSYSSVSKSSSPQSSTPSPSPSDSPETDKLSKILNIGDLELLEFYVKQVAVGKMKKNPLNISSASDLLGIAISNQDLALKFCTDCPGADLLDQEDVEVLFRHYSFSMIWMDSIWAAASEESCSTLDGEEDLLHDFISYLKSTLIPSFSRLQLNIHEFAALKAFCIWKLGIHDSSLSMKIVAQEQYVSVTSALRKYYEGSTTMESFEIATRIAEITLQIGPISAAYREMLRVYEAFGISVSMP